MPRKDSTVIQIFIYKIERKLPELGMVKRLEPSVLNPLYSVPYYPLPQKRGTKPHMEKSLHFGIFS